MEVLSVPYGSIAEKDEWPWQPVLDAIVGHLRKRSADVSDVTAAYHEANAAKGKLFARERIALLVDDAVAEAAVRSKHQQITFFLRRMTTPNRLGGSVREGP